MEPGFDYLSLQGALKLEYLKAVRSSKFLPDKKKHLFCEQIHFVNGEAHHEIKTLPITMWKYLWNIF